MLTCAIPTTRTFGRRFSACRSNSHGSRISETPTPTICKSCKCMPSYSWVARLFALRPRPAPPSPFCFADDVVCTRTHAHVHARTCTCTITQYNIGTCVHERTNARTHERTHTRTCPGVAGDWAFRNDTGKPPAAQRPSVSANASRVDTEGSQRPKYGRSWGFWAPCSGVEGVAGCLPAADECLAGRSKEAAGAVP